MLRAMADADTSTWSNRDESVAALVAWWTNVPSYDPDMEPETLIFQTNLSPLAKEVLGAAAAHRVRPSALAIGIPTEPELKQWLGSSSARVLRQALEFDSNAAWWNRCLFENSDTLYHSRTEHLVTNLMSDHTFVHMSVGLNVPLVEMLPAMATPNAILPFDPPELPDLC